MMSGPIGFKVTEFVFDIRRFAAASPDRASRLGIWMLGFGQTIIWAFIYYVFAALLLTWEQTLGFAKAELTLGLTVAILAAAVTSPLAGRLIDAGRGRWVLGAGAMFGAASLYGLSMVETPTGFVVIWALIGVAQGCALYEPCFSVVTRALGAKARPGITRITLLAGLASTLCFLSSSALLDFFDWRETVRIFAAASALLAAPLLYFGALLIESAGKDAIPPSTASANKAALRAAFRKPQFWLLALAFPLMALNHGILLNHIMPLLAERNIPKDTAILIASTFGPMQVAGRIALMLMDRRVNSLGATIAAFSVVCLAALILWRAGGSVELTFLFAAMQGAAYGLTSILKPAITAEFLGRVGFGAIAGWLALTYLFGSAFAPHLGAIIWGIGGYDLVVPATAGFAALGALAMTGLAIAGRAGRAKERAEG